MEIIADGRRQVAEADDENNTATLFITCAVQPKPDLTIADLKLGSNILYKITNIGQAPAAASATTLRIDGVVVDTGAEAR